MIILYFQVLPPQRRHHLKRDDAAVLRNFSQASSGLISSRLCSPKRMNTFAAPRISSQPDHQTSVSVVQDSCLVDGFSWSPSWLQGPSNFQRIKNEFSGSDEFTRTTSIETCRCCKWLKIAEVGGKISQKIFKNSNWVWSEIECLLILHSSYSSFSLQDLPGFLKLSQFQSSWFGTFPFSIDWILADSHPATSCCALQEAKRFLGLPTMIVDKCCTKQHANAPSMLRQCHRTFSPGSRIKYWWQVFLPPGATPPKCGKRDTWTALHGLCIWHRTPTKKWRAIYWFE